MDVEQILENICENTRKQLPEFTAHLSWSKQQIKEHQLKKLKQLFTHVLQHSPHYQERLKDIDLNKLALHAYPESLCNNVIAW